MEVVGFYGILVQNHMQLKFLTFWFLFVSFCFQYFFPHMILGPMDLKPLDLGWTGPVVNPALSQGHSMCASCTPRRPKREQKTWGTFEVKKGKLMDIWGKRRKLELSPTWNCEAGYAPETRTKLQITNMKLFFSQIWIASFSLLNHGYFHTI